MQDESLQPLSRSWGWNAQREKFGLEVRIRANRYLRSNQRPGLNNGHTTVLIQASIWTRWHLLQIYKSVQLKFNVDLYWETAHKGYFSCLFPPKTLSKPRGSRRTTKFTNTNAEHRESHKEEKKGLILVARWTEKKKGDHERKKREIVEQKPRKGRPETMETLDNSTGTRLCERKQILSLFLPRPDFGIKIAFVSNTQDANGKRKG